jgi:predicted nucleotide-binding protein (sugar kinase/HSP70/actin superfamily)
MKIHLGHLKWLIDSGVDYLFVPALSSRYKHMVYCPKIVAIPDILYSLARKDSSIVLPKLIQPYYAVSKKGHTKWRFFRDVYSIGRLFTHNPLQIYRASKKAFQAQEDYWRKIILDTATFRKWEGSEITLQNIPQKWSKEDIVKVAVVAHSYTLNDRIGSMDIQRKLPLLGADFITSDQMPREYITQAMEEYDPKFKELFYFELEQRIIGTVLHFLKHRSVDLILYACNFCCGPGSFTKQFVKQISLILDDIPVIDLSLDVHSEEAIFQTRLESNINLTRSRLREERLDPLSIAREEKPLVQLPKLYWEKK